MAPEIFKNIEFFVYLILTIFIVNVSKKFSLPLSKILLIIASLAFIYSLPVVAAPYLIGIFTTITFSFAVAKFLIALKKKKHPKIKKIFWLLVSGLILLFVCLKLRFWLDWIPGFNQEHWFAESILPAIGFSYVAIKIYSVWTDSRNGRIKEISFTDYINYFLFFPTFMAGPIMRWQEWQSTFESYANESRPFNHWREAIPRLCIGLLKTFTIAPLIKPYILAAQKTRDFDETGIVYIGIMSYYFYEYINFSGYTDLAISTGRLFGIKVPENFNFPFLGIGLSGLWRRWHMTLAHWLRDYIFYPVTFVLSAKWQAKTRFKRTAATATGMFITFSICGIWHGDNYGILYFGFTSGLIMAIEAFIETYLGPKFKAINAKGRIQELFLVNTGRIVTLHVACISFAPVLMTDEQFIQFFKVWF